MLLNRNMDLLARLDCFIVWGHGTKYIEDIIELISRSETLKILHLEKQKAGNLKKLVRAIYSFDYAPLIHLKAKIKYLEKTPPELFFIFVKNSDPQIEYFGEGRFRHIECLVVRTLKQEIRELYNPKDEQGKLTHDHVVHATDNESQTDSILKLLGYSQGIKKLSSRKKIILSPHYIKERDNFSVKCLKLSDLLCGNAVKEGVKNIVKVIPVENSVQYRSLFDEELYKRYLANFRGTVLRQDYNAERFFALKDSFKYLDKDHRDGFIIVEKTHSGMHVIIDGLHRAALHLYRGNEYIKACVYE